MLVQFDELLIASCQKGPKPYAQTVLRIFQQVRNRPTKSRESLWKTDAVFTEQPPSRIAQCRTIPNTLRAHPVNCLHVMRFHGLNGDKLDSWSVESFGNRVGIVVVILVALYQGLHILRWDQFHLMTQRLQFTSPVVRCSTGFHANLAGWQLSKELAHLAASEHAFLHLFVAIVEADDMKNVLCQIQTDGGNIHDGLLSLR